MKNNLYVFFLFFITGLMSCSHHSGLYEQAEKIMSQHPDSVLTLLSTIQDVNDLSEKDRAMYYLLLTEAENKTYVKPTSDSLITIAVEYFDKTEDWERKAKAWYYRGRINQDLGDALKYLVKKERPDFSDNHSFPSMHTSVSFAGAAFIQRRYGWKWGIPAYAVSTYVGWSRVYGKKHDWWDVAAGAVIGAGSAYIFTRPFAKKHNLSISPVAGDGHYGIYASMTF